MHSFNCTFISIAQLTVYGPGAYVIKLFSPYFMNFPNKLECLSLASLSSLLYCLQVRKGAYPRVENLNDASLGYAPA